MKLELGLNTNVQKMLYLLDDLILNDCWTHYQRFLLVVFISKSIESKGLLQQLNKPYNRILF